MQKNLVRTSTLLLCAGVIGLVGSRTRAQGHLPINPVPKCSLYPDIPYYPGASSCPGVSTGPCVPIAPGSTQCLDVRIPSVVTHPSPTILFIHGGGWNGGNKDGATVADFFGHLCELGYRVASTNYTLSCDNGPSFPQAVLDVRAAVGWIKTQGAAYNLSDCIVVVGGSAGGHLAAMVGALGSDNVNYTPLDYAGVDLSVRLTITVSGDFDPYRRGCEATSCPWFPLCEPSNDSHPAAYPNGVDIAELFVGFQWGVAVPNQYTPFPCPSGTWNYQALNPGLPTADPFLNASPVHWLNPTSSPFYMIHSNCDQFFPTIEPDWLIAAALPYGIPTDKLVTGCGHGLRILGQIGSADKVDDVIQNSGLYSRCP